MRHTIFSENFNDFLGDGIASNPVAGQLDSGVWTVEGFSSASDLSRGETDGSVGTGGLYAVDRGEDEGNGLLLQPGGSDFTPGNLTLNLSSGESDLTDVTVSFDRLVNNDQGRANSFDFSYSLDGVTFITLDSFVSAAAADANGLTSETVTVTLPDLPAGTDFQLRWTGNDVDGSGSRDEFGIDNLVVDGVSADDEPSDTPEAAFTLELLHIADQEASSAAVVDAPNLSAVLNALRDQDLGNDGVADNTLTLSSGDAIIPGIFFDASEAVFGSAGIADIQIQNELGIQAIALGNHEFDFGTGTLADLISGEAEGSILGEDFGGADFAYLSANLDFSTDANLAPLAVEGGNAPLANTVTSSVVLETNGEKIGVVGATTPTLGRISSPGDLGILPGEFDDTPTDAQLDALAAQIQSEVDALLAADPSLNKIILLAHMQQINIEQALATRLVDVDIIVAGGSNTRLFDENDRPRDGDSSQGVYPIIIDNAGGTQTAVVNTDGSYKYVGRLVLDFDADGNIIPESYDAEVSGAYATDAQGVADLGAEDLVDAEIQEIADAIEEQIIATESNVFGSSDVFLNGNRSGVEGDADGVRTQETNLGNLTADANLAAAQESDEAVVVSIKNGGGIRASIGETVVLPGDVTATRLPNGEIVDSEGNIVKEEGGISQTDIQTALAFNNGLTLLTLTRAELVAVLEHGVSALPGVAGQFAQISGVEFSFDPDLEAGSRIVNAEIVDAEGNQIAELVRDGVISGEPTETFRIVTLSFLADGGDGYPFPTGEAANRVDLTQDDDAVRTGEATFAADGSEQDALAEYLADLDAPFAEEDTNAAGDTRIQNLNFREDTVFEDGDVFDGDEVIINEVLASTTGADSEYVELFGTPGASLEGLSFIAVESNDNATPGTIDFRFDFAEGDVIGANGFFLIANDTAQATYGVVANATISDTLENSSATYALVQTSSLNGTSVTGSEVVLDAVASFDSSDSTAFFDAPVVGPDGNFFPAGVGRVEDGVDTDSTEDFAILSFVNDDAVNTPTAGTVAETFVESFENAPGETYTIDGAFDDGGFDFFGRFAAPDNGNGARDDFSNFDGDFAIFAQDNDGEGGSATQVITISDIDVSLYADPQLTLSLGALDSTAFDNYEDGDGIRIYANLDEGGRELIGQFVTDGEPGNLLQDTDLDGIGDGATLTTVLQDFTFALPEGNVLDLEIELTSDASFEPLVVDNVRVGDEIPDVGSDLTLDDEPTVISAVQGTEDTAALVGQTVVIEAIVTGDFQNGDADTFRDLGGFFLMEEIADRDDNALTSEGIFAYEGADDLLVDVQDGDRVRVLGTVVERFGKTSIEVTEIRVEEAGAVDPLSLAVTVALPDVANREALESQLVTIDEALTFSESFDYEDFGDATLTTDGVVYQYTQLNAPDVEGFAAYQEEVANRSITISGGSSGRRDDFDPITEPDGDLVGSATDGIRMGQSVSNLTAIFDYDFGEYRLRLPEEVEFELDADSNPIPAEPEDVGSDYKVASLNVLNFFTTLDGATDNGNSPRGADSAEELARQTSKLVEAIVGLDSDVVGLVEIENDFAGEEFALKTLVEAINEAEGTDTWAFVDPGTEFVGDDAIAVAFIYNSATTDLVGDAAILDTAEFIDPLGANDGGENRAALAQTFQDKESGGIFTASVNHFKSKGSLTGVAADEDQGDGAGNNNATRTEAARLLAEWLATDPTNSGDSDVVILGDLNAYAQETPITTLEDAGYTNLSSHFEGDEAYSFRFSGQVGTLDYALANESLFDQVTGATTWNINSDTPVFFDYNLDRTFTNQDRPTDQGLFDGDTPLRSSDHDPLIIGLQLDDDREIIIAGDSGNDRLVGTDGDDIIRSGGGRLDLAEGGAGADVFVFEDIEGQRDLLRILDFDTETDVLDLGDATIATARALGANLFISLEDDRDAIYLSGVTDIDAVNFADDDLIFV